MKFTHTLVTNQRQLAALARQLAGRPAVVLDCETTVGLHPYLDQRPLLLGLSPLDAEEYWAVPAGHPEGPQLDLAPLWDALRGVPLINHSIKFDRHVLAALGFEYHDEPLIDIKVAARLATGLEHPDLDLASLARAALDYTYVENLKKERKNLIAQTLERVALYCCEDVYCAKHLYHHYKATLGPREQKLWEREVEVTRTLWYMERTGWHFDPDYLLELSGEDGQGGKLGRVVDDLMTWLRKDSGDPKFNPNSNPQVTKYLGSQGIKPLAWSEKTKAPSWPREVLLQTGYEGAIKIAQVRSVVNTQDNTIAVVHHYLAQGATVLHPEYDNAGTTPGRLSSRRPNAQNFKKGWLQLGEVGYDEFGAEEPLKWDEEGEQREIAVRRLFIPRPGRVLNSIDYRQLEMFILGYYMRDPDFFKLLEGDFHGNVVTSVWGYEPGTPEFKLARSKRAKPLGFGLNYGLGLEKQARYMGVDKATADAWRNKYFARIPRFRPFSRHVRRSLEAQGYVRNFYGRKYEVDPERSYVALNWLIQGSAGDFVKFRMPHLLEHWRAASGGQTDILFANVHDEVDSDVPEELIQSELPEVVRLLETSPFGFPLPTDPRLSRVSLADLAAPEEVLEYAA